MSVVLVAAVACSLTGPASHPHMAARLGDIPALSAAAAKCPWLLDAGSDLGDAAAPVLSVARDSKTFLWISSRFPSAARGNEFRILDDIAQRPQTLWGSAVSRKAVSLGWPDSPATRAAASAPSESEEEELAGLSAKMLWASLDDVSRRRVTSDAISHANEHLLVRLAEIRDISGRGAVPPPEPVPVVGSAWPCPPLSRMSRAAAAVSRLFGSAPVVARFNPGVCHDRLEGR